MAKREPPRLVYDDGVVQLYHGDGVEALRTWDGAPIGALITDPPYSSGGMTRGDRVNQTTRSKYQQSGSRGGSNAPLYAEFSGDNRDQLGFMAWMAMWTGFARSVMLSGAPFAVFSDWRQVPIASMALQAGGLVLRGMAVWDKTEGSRPQKGRPRAQCEFIVWGSNGPMPGPPEAPVLPGCWRMSVSHKKLHMTEKPPELMRDLCRLAWRPDGVVLDPFAGSATTLAACKALGRRAIGYEINEEVLAAALARLEGTGLDAATAAEPMFDLMAADNE